MNWKLLLVTFGSILLAELGDKTQLATVSFAAASRSFWPVFIGSSLALVATSLIGTLCGSLLARFLPLRWVNIGAGAIFITLGILLILRNLRG
ncbi:MAG: TMEM165/GDT1 family protein [candidate division WOR-3 bacterium]